MKKYIYYIAALFVLLTSAACSDDDTPTFIPAAFELTPGEGAEVAIAPDITTGTVTFSYEEKSVTILVKTNQTEWNYTAEQAGEHFTISRSGDNLTISVPENKTSLPYTGTIVLNTGTDDNFTRCVLTLSQEKAPDPELTVSPQSVVLPYEGGEAELTVTTNKDRWTVRKSQDYFIIVSKVNDTKVLVKADANHTPVALSGAVIVTSGEGENTIDAEISVIQEAAPQVKVDVDKSSLEFETEGGEETVAVTLENADDWNFQCKETWLTVKREGNQLVVTVPANQTANTPSAQILVYAGDKYYSNYDETLISVHQKGQENAGALVFELTIPEPQNGEVTALLPIDGLANCTIDWGDGSQPDQPTAKIPSHIYTKGGVYQVAVRGGVTRINSDDFRFAYPDEAATGAKNYITAILNWGNTGLKSMEKACYALPNLKSVPADTEGAFAKVTTFENAFCDCSALESISSGLFAYATSAKSFDYCFETCVALKEIPAGLFKNCTSAEGFYGAFYECEALTAVPDELFAGLAKVEEFSRLFADCPNLKTVGNDVFKGCTQVTSFNQIFIYCENIESVPVNIFDDCRNVTDFRYAFESDAKLTGESPYTMVEDKKVHLYERNSYPSLFAPVTSYTECFTGCTGLSDYAAITAAGWN